MFGKRKVAMLLAEFLGTGALTLLVLSIQRSTIGVPFFVAIGAGLTVVLMSFAVGGVSGGHFNPAITIGLWTVRKVSAATVVMFIAAQLLGAWAAHYLYTYFSHMPLQAIGGHYTTRVMVAELIGASIFAFGFAAAIYQRFSRATNAAYIGLALMLGIVAASTASYGLLNPAVALGIRAWEITGSLGWGTYVLGPILGGLIGFNLYAWVFADEAPMKLNFGSSSSSTSVAAKTTAVKKPAARKKTASKKK